MPPIDPTTSGVRLTLHVQPRAARTECAGHHGDAIKVRLAAPPVDGAANEALLRFLAERLGVARAALTLRAGATSRRKVVEVLGLNVDTAARRLEVGGARPTG
ncbi:MAG TPA: DUF167 domain-containing protein [Gemmatimonadales bacterium]|nr:DUF167 domain-containing protein [Gemmatimonadales bacterium]